jgi:hypothetical protein
MVPCSCLPSHPGRPRPHSPPSASRPPRPAPPDAPRFHSCRNTLCLAAPIPIYHLEGAVVSASSDRVWMPSTLLYAMRTTVAIRDRCSMSESSPNRDANLRVFDYSFDIKNKKNKSLRPALPLPTGQRSPFARCAVTLLARRPCLLRGLASSGLPGIARLSTCEACTLRPFPPNV